MARTSSTSLFLLGAFILGGITGAVLLHLFSGQAPEQANSFQQERYLNEDASPTDSPGVSVDKPSAPTSEEVKELKQEAASWKSKYEKAEAAGAESELMLTKLRDERDDYEAKLLDMENIASTKPALMGKDLPIDYGDWGEMEGLRTMPWDEMGDAKSRMAPLMRQLALKAEETGVLDQAILAKIQKENPALLKGAIKIISKLPTSLPNVNGEFTHPVLVTNLLLKHLEIAGQPLSGSQLNEVKSAAEKYDQEWEKLMEAYTDKTLLVEKVADEVELKQDTMDTIAKLLTKEQYDVIFDDETRGTSGDLYSPCLMIQNGVVQDLSGADIDTVKARLSDAVSTHWNLDESDLNSFGYLLDEWARQMTQKITPSQSDFVFSAGEAIIAARHQAKVGNEIIQQLAPDDERRKSIREYSNILLPRLSKQK